MTGFAWKRYAFRSRSADRSLSPRLRWSSYSWTGSKLRRRSTKVMALGAPFRHLRHERHGICVKGCPDLARIEPAQLWAHQLLEAGGAGMRVEAP
jgi:hypothetical protein